MSKTNFFHFLNDLKVLQKDSNLDLLNKFELEKKKVIDRIIKPFSVFILVSLLLILMIDNNLFNGLLSFFLYMKGSTLTMMLINSKLTLIGFYIGVLIFTFIGTFMMFKIYQFMLNYLIYLSLKRRV